MPVTRNVALSLSYLENRLLSCDFAVPLSGCTKAFLPMYKNTAKYPVQTQLNLLYSFKPVRAYA